MRPILFDKSAREFNTNGLGRLDCVSCEVSWQANGERELEAVVSVESKHASEAVVDNIICVIPYDGGTLQAFRIYKVTKPMSGTFKVLARHISYWLSYIPVRPFTATTVTQALQRLKANAMAECPFTFETDKTTTANYNQTTPDSILSRLGGVEGSILDVYGGEYEFDNFRVKLWNDYGRDQNITIRYGKNLTDINQEISIEDTVTGIVPYWMSETEVAYYNAIVEADTAGNFAHKRAVPYDFSSDFDEKPTSAQLLARAQRYITRNKLGIPKHNIKVSFVALWQTDEYKNIAPLERVRVFDTITVYYPELDISAKAQIIKTRYDCIRERYIEVEIGELRSDFANTVVGLTDALASKANVLTVRQNQTEIKLGNQGALVTEIRNQVNAIDAKVGDTSVSETIDKALDDFEVEMNAAIEDATDKIIGAKGGVIVTHLNNDGQPYELLVTDNANLNRAKNVWRWNINGLGFSGTGYNGKYGTAITQDGAIVADYITAGSLNAGIIKTGILDATLLRAGIIIDKANKFRWNLNTGDFVGNGGTFNNINANGGTFKNISATGGTFKNMTATGGTFNNVTANGGTFKNINITDGSLSNIAAVGGTFRNITATGGTFTNITATGGTFTNATFVNVNLQNLSATGTLRTIGPVGSDGYKPYMELAGGQLIAGKIANNQDVPGGFFDFDNSIDSYPCMRISSPALYLTGRIYTNTSSSSVADAKKGINYAYSTFAADIDFTEAIIAEDITMDWTNIGLKFINGLLVRSTKTSEGGTTMYWHEDEQKYTYVPVPE